MRLYCKYSSVIDFEVHLYAREPPVYLRCLTMTAVFEGFPQLLLFYK